jgi:tetratricopeptide (TPR) repeat protein
MVQFGTPGISVGRLSSQGFLFRYGESSVPPGAGAGAELTSLLDSISAGATDLLTKDFVARTAFNLGVYFDRVDDLKSAFQLFQYAVTADDANPEYLFRLGVAFFKGGRFNEAAMLLEQATKTGDGCPEAETLLRRIRNKEFSKR